VVAANRGITMLLDDIPEALLTQPLNAMRLTLHPEGLAPRIRNFREWRGHLLVQMERQIALQRSAPLRELYEEVAAYPVPESATDAVRNTPRSSRSPEVTPRKRNMADCTQTFGA